MIQDWRAGSKLFSPLMLLHDHCRSLVCYSCHEDRIPTCQQSFAANSSMSRPFAASKYSPRYSNIRVVHSPSIRTSSEAPQDPVPSTRVFAHGLAGQKSASFSFKASRNSLPFVRVRQIYTSIYSNFHGSSAVSVGTSSSFFTERTVVLHPGARTSLVTYSEKRSCWKQTDGPGHHLAT